MKLSVFADNMTFYIENPKDSKKKKKKKTKLIKEFSEVAGYKVNIQKSVALLYTNNKLTKGEWKKTILFTIASKRISRNKLNQGGQRLVH